MAPHPPSPGVWCPTSTSTHLPDSAALHHGSKAGFPERRVTNVITARQAGAPGGCPRLGSLPQAFALHMLQTQVTRGTKSPQSRTSILNRLERWWFHMASLQMTSRPRSQLAGSCSARTPACTLLLPCLPCLHRCFLRSHFPMPWERLSWAVSPRESRLMGFHPGIWTARWGGM